jgi:hypothetical protein
MCTYYTVIAYISNGRRGEEERNPGEEAKAFDVYISLMVRGQSSDGEVIY